MRVTVVNLSQVALSISDGDHQAPPRAASGIPFLTIAAINNGRLEIDRATRYVPKIYFSALKPERKPQIGDVLYSVTGSIGIPAIVDDSRPFVFQRHIAIIRPDPRIIDTKYLWHTLQTEAIKEQLHSVATGTAQLTVPLSGLRGFTLPLPPLPEQRRIVAKIDSLTAKSRRARDHLDHIPRLVEKYKQAILAAAFRGDLTREWRTSQRLPAPVATRLAELLREPIRNGLSVRGSDTPPGVRSLRLSALRNCNVNLFDVRYLPIPESRAERFLLSEGDVLISRGNGTKAFVGLAALVGEISEPTIFPDTAFRLRFDPEKALPHWVARIWNAEPVRQQIENVAKTTAGIWKISQSDLDRLQLVWPTVPEQEEISKRIETAFAWIDRLAAEATNARTLIDRLDQAVLAKAFRGELVPQDPADEPASVLLERIRAERGAAPKARRGRRPAAEG